MRIAVIGAGNVGATLARRWSALGHEVVLGVQDPTSEKSRAVAGELGILVKTSLEAARHADIVLLATPGDVTIEAARACGDLREKIIVDATNPLLPQMAGLNHPEGRSGAEQLAQAIPEARVVKAFNTVGFGIMAEPVVGGHRSVLFVSGDDEEAVNRVLNLATETGFESIHLGGLAASRMQEEHALLWIHLAYKGGLGRDFAFSVNRR
jgi:hypothetical protein